MIQDTKNSTVVPWKIDNMQNIPDDTLAQLVRKTREKTFLRRYREPNLLNFFEDSINFGNNSTVVTNAIN